MIEESKNNDGNESGPDKNIFSARSFGGDQLDPEIQAQLITDQIKFNGFFFELSADRTKPALLRLDSHYSTFPEQRNFVGFLEILKRHGMFNQPNTSKIVYVEDQHVNCY